METRYPSPIWTEQVVSICNSKINIRDGLEFQWAHLRDLNKLNKNY